MSTITIAVKVKLNGCDIHKVCNILSTGEEVLVDGVDHVIFNQELIDELLCELTRLKLVAEE